MNSYSKICFPQSTNTGHSTKVRIPQRSQSTKIRHESKVRIPQRSQSTKTRHSSKATQRSQSTNARHSSKVRIPQRSHSTNVWQASRVQTPQNTNIMHPARDRRVHKKPQNQTNILPTNVANINLGRHSIPQYQAYLLSRSLLGHEYRKPIYKGDKYRYNRYRYRHRYNSIDSSQSGRQQAKPRDKTSHRKASSNSQILWAVKIGHIHLLDETHVLGQERNSVKVNLFNLRQISDKKTAKSFTRTNRPTATNGLDKRKSNPKVIIAKRGDHLHRENERYTYHKMRPCYIRLSIGAKKHKLLELASNPKLKPESLLPSPVISHIVKLLDNLKLLILAKLTPVSSMPTAGEARLAATKRNRSPEEDSNNNVTQNAAKKPATPKQILRSPSPPSILLANERPKNQQKKLDPQRLS